MQNDIAEILKLNYESVDYFTLWSLFSQFLDTYEGIFEVFFSKIRVNLENMKNITWEVSWCFIYYVHTTTLEKVILLFY